jgi:hypothetical protein
MNIIFKKAFQFQLDFKRSFVLLLFTMKQDNVNFSAQKA